MYLKIPLKASIMIWLSNSGRKIGKRSFIGYIYILAKGCSLDSMLGNLQLEGGLPLPRGGGVEGLWMNVFLNEKFSIFKS